MSAHAVAPSGQASADVPPRRWRDLAAVALAVWLGIHALRVFWSMIVWKVGEDRTPPEMALIALAIWIVGLLAWPVVRRFGGAHPERPVALLFAALHVASAWTAHSVLTPALGLAAAVAWLWFLPALVVSLADRQAGHALVPGALLGLAAQVALQTALGGLDLPVLRGAGPGVGTLLLAGALLAVLAGRRTLPSREGSGAPYAGLGLAALGPYLLLQLVLLANPGRVQSLTGWDLLPASGLVLLGLAAGAAALLAAPPLLGRVALGAAAVAMVARPGLLEGSGVWLLVVAQALLAPIVAAAVAPGRAASPGRTYGGIVLAALVYFVLMFLYYSRYGWTALWPVMAALAVLPAVRAPAAPRNKLGPAAAGMVVLVGIGGLAGSAAGRYEPAHAAEPAPAELTVMTYNIHKAFSADGIPDPEAIARVIEEADADVVGLQEVGRGWNINGGPDLVSWLRRRLPQYRVVYAPMLGDLVGDAILSRYPLEEWGWQAYPRRQSTFRYGLMWATVRTEAGVMLFANTHFSPYDGFEADRTAQAGDLLAFWDGRPRAVLLGDTNAEPDWPSMQRLFRAGLVDLTVPHGLGTARTFVNPDPSARRDYVLGSPDVTSLSAAIPTTRASDHLPVIVRIRLREGGR